MLKDDIQGRIIEAAMTLAATRGWANTSLREIAEEAGMSLAALHTHALDKTDILVMLGRRIDARVLENATQDGDDDSVHDRLFDVLMERYEILNDYRDGLVAVLGSFTLDPKQAVISLPHLCRSMTWMMEAAGIDTGGITGAAKLAGVTAVYLKGLKAWRDDESADLAATMATLDKDLGRAEKLASMIGLLAV